MISIYVPSICDPPYIFFREFTLWHSVVVFTASFLGPLLSVLVFPLLSTLQLVEVELSTENYVQQDIIYGIL